MSAESKLNALVDGALRSHCLRAIYDLKIDRILNKKKRYLTVEEFCSEIEENSINPEVLQRIMRYMTRFDLFDEKYENEKFFFKITEVLQNHEPHELIDKVEVASNIKDLLTNKTNGKVYLSMLEVPKCETISRMTKTKDTKKILKHLW